MIKDGCSTSSSGITIESMKYLHNLLEMPILSALLLIGIVLVLFGIYKSSRSVQYRKGIWFTGIGTVLTVLVLLLIAGWNNTAYYPSNIDLQSSLTLANSCSSEFTLRTMAIVSLLIPFVLAYNVFGDWALAICAYNCGFGGVRKAIARSGGKTAYWDIYRFLPKETRYYVPAMVGALYTIRYSNELGIKPAAPALPAVTDTLEVHGKLHLKQVHDLVRRWNSPCP